MHDFLFFAVGGGSRILLLKLEENHMSNVNAILRRPNGPHRRSGNPDLVDDDDDDDDDDGNENDDNGDE